MTEAGHQCVPMRVESCKAKSGPSCDFSGLSTPASTSSGRSAGSDGVLPPFVRHFCCVLALAYKELTDITPTFNEANALNAAVKTFQRRLSHIGGMNIIRQTCSRGVIQEEFSKRLIQYKVCSFFSAHSEAILKILMSEWPTDDDYIFEKTLTYLRGDFFSKELFGHIAERLNSPVAAPSLTSAFLMFTNKVIVNPSSCLEDIYGMPVDDFHGFRKALDFSLSKLGKLKDMPPYDFDSAKDFALEWLSRMGLLLSEFANDPTHSFAVPFLIHCKSAGKLRIAIRNHLSNSVCMSKNPIDKANYVLEKVESFFISSGCLEEANKQFLSLKYDPRLSARNLMDELKTRFRRCQEGYSCDDDPKSDYFTERLVYQFRDSVRFHRSMFETVCTIIEEVGSRCFLNTDDFVELVDLSSSTGHSSSESRRAHLRVLMEQRIHKLEKIAHTLLPRQVCKIICQRCFDGIHTPWECTGELIGYSVACRSCGSYEHKHCDFAIRPGVCLKTGAYHPIGQSLYKKNFGFACRRCFDAFHDPSKCSNPFPGVKFRCMTCGSFDHKECVTTESCTRCGMKRHLATGCRR